ncbi:DNA helicase [Trifolium repens]|nr:DNA helicase [Trifolium repens]
MNLEIGPTKNNHQEAQSDHLAEYMEFNRFLKSEEQAYSDIGDMDIVCEKCGALAWIGEIDKSSNSAAMVSLVLMVD